MMHSSFYSLGQSLTHDLPLVRSHKQAGVRLAGKSQRVPADFTFVIPAYRSAETIGRTVNSALQEGRGSPVIVVFDGPDREAQQRLPHAKNLKVVIRPENRGACVTRNIGLEKCRTRYVMFLDADDVVEGGIIANALRRARAQDADIVFSDFLLEYVDGSRSGAIHPGRSTNPAELFAEWMKGEFVSPCAIVWRADFVRHIGGWNEGLTQNQDGELMYRALAAAPRIAWNNRGYGVYREHMGHRVSRRMSEAEVRSQFAALAIAREINAEKNLVEPRIVGICYYNLARRLYARGYAAAGDRALAEARQLGFDSHFGGLFHKGLASMLGLQNKVRLTGGIRRSLRSFNTVAAQFGLGRGS